jgi:hypothetical protein
MKTKNILEAGGFILLLWWALPFVLLGCALLELDKRR